ncbi:MAG TPA: Holliday junction branch migration protein RuvA [Lachnospiraceae bacterium]|nr:Holliday junction branch migration protein RuvA [Lachnospiraceae bacterium]
MIAYLKGTVAAIYEQQIVLEVNGIGYNITMAGSSLDILGGIGEEKKIYTCLSVREDAMQLYGFLTKDDLDLFRLLIQVSGIGPKGALSLLSAMTADDLRFAIVSADAKTISKAPGIGAKTAQRVIIDLKDKISLKDALEAEFGGAESDTANISGGAQSEAAEALVALGYSQASAYKAVRTVASEAGDDVERLLKLALKVING